MYFITQSSFITFWNIVQNCWFLNWIKFFFFNIIPPSKNSFHLPNVMPPFVFVFWTEQKIFYQWFLFIFCFHSEEDNGIQAEGYSFAADPLGPNTSISSFLLTAKFGALDVYSLRKPSDSSWSRKVSVERQTRPRVLPLGKPDDLPWARAPAGGSPQGVENREGTRLRKRYRVSTPIRPIRPSN